MPLSDLKCQNKPDHKDRPAVAFYVFKGMSAPFRAVRLCHNCADEALWNGVYVQPITNLWTPVPTGEEP